jgi:hypothetical protein
MTDTLVSCPLPSSFNSGEVTIRFENVVVTSYQKEWPNRASQKRSKERFCPSLLPLCAVVPAPVAGIAPVRPDFDTGGLALLADRAVVLHPGGLWLLVHGK